MRRISKSRPIFFLLSAALVVPLLSTTLLGAPAEEEGDGDSFYKYLSVFTEVLRLVRQVYVEEPELRSLMAGALDGTSDALDPFSVYVPADQVEGYLEALDVGRGHSGLLVLKERGVVYVVAVEEGSPAAAAAIERGDIIAELNGRSSRAMPLWQIRQLLAGEPGSQLELELVRRGSTRNLAFELQAFDLPAARLEKRRGLAVLRIPSFYETTPAQVAEILSQLEEERLLIDLRGVAGGDAEAAYTVAGEFARGELGQLRAGEGSGRQFAGPAEEVWEGELGVLVDRGSQGAAEILAAVLRQLADAKLLGEGTFGHAATASRVRLGSGGLLEITDAFYTGPDGEPLDESLEPDLEVGPTHLRGGEQTGDADPILERAVDLFLEAVQPAEDEAA